jgi:hypothetical protein
MELGHKLSPYPLIHCCTLFRYGVGPKICCDIDITSTACQGNHSQPLHDKIDYVQVVILFDVAHCLMFICYTRRFGNSMHSPLQVIITILTHTRVYPKVSGLRR